MQGGFLEERQKNPVGLGAVIVLHAAVLAAVMLAPPELIRDPIIHLVAYPVPDDPPPPPLKETPKPEHRQAKPETVDHPATVVDHPTTDDTKIAVIDQSKFPAIDQLPKVDPLPLPPVPVTVPARPDPRAGEMQPPYPSALARAEIEGRAEVRVLIGTDGRVKQVELVSTTDPGFFEATKQQALRHWRFVPATRDGVAVESWRTMTVRFQLQA